MDDMYLCAQKRYLALGVDTEKAIAALKEVPVGRHSGDGQLSRQGAEF